MAHISIFSTPLSVLASLSDDRLQEAAAQAGVSVEKLRALVKRASDGYAAQQAKKAELAEAEALLAQKFRLVPERLRVTVDAMRLTVERELLAERLEREAYALLEAETPGPSASQKFQESKLIVYRGLLRETSLEVALSHAMGQVAQKCRSECLNLRNIPRFRDAAWRALTALRKEVAGDEGDSNYLPIDGPALVYSVNVPLNFPFHPRPRRYNDELEHY